MIHLFHVYLEWNGMKYVPAGLLIVSDHGIIPAGYTDRETGTGWKMTCRDWKTIPGPAAAHTETGRRYPDRLEDDLQIFQLTLFYAM